MIDHLLWAVPELAAGCRDFAARCGVVAAPGGRHPGVGTHNALLALDGERYLEIIARDPEQTKTSGLGRHVEGVETPGLLTWCARSEDLEATARAARRAGLAVEEITEMSRQRPDGTELSWRLLFLEEPEKAEPFGLLLPFFIEWGAGVAHPSRDAPGGLRLRRFTLTHPRGGELRRLLEALGLGAAGVEIADGPSPALSAILETPRGMVELATQAKVPGPRRSGFGHK